MAAPTFRAAGARSAGPFAYPSGITAGDELHLHVVVETTEGTHSEAPALTPPSGWALIGECGGPTGTAPNRTWRQSYLLRKTGGATGSESGTLAVSADTGSVIAGRMYCYVGGSGAQEGAAVANTNAAGTAINQASITTTGADRLCCHYVYWSANATIGDFTGETGGNFTEAVAESSAASGTLQVQTATLASAGTISGGSVTVTSGSYRQRLVVAIYNTATNYSLSATAVATGSPSVGAPSLTQKHSLSATALSTPAPSVGSPALTQKHSLSALALSTPAPSVGAPSLTIGGYSLSAQAISTPAPSVGAPALTQKHALSGSSVSTPAPSVGSPAITQAHGFAPVALSSGTPSTGAPGLTQTHKLSALPLVAGVPSVGSARIQNWIASTSGSRITRALLVEMLLETSNVYVHDGIGPLTWNDKTWLGVGDLGAISGISGGVDLDASDMSMMLGGVPSDYREEVLTELARGKRVNVYQGIINAATGQWSYDPELVYAGFIDAPDIAEEISENLAAHLTITVPVIAASSYVRRLSQWRRTDADQEELFPGDKFFAFKTDLKIPVPNASRSRGGGGGGGFTFGPGGFSGTRLRRFN
jgi:hypothetical protein